jgi:hypothetical protein
MIPSDAERTAHLIVKAAFDEHVKDEVVARAEG